MHLRSTALLAITVGVTAGSFVTACDFGVPDGAQLACNASSGCPEGYECQADLGRCLLRGTAYQLPTIQAVSLSPTLAGADDTVTIVAQVSGQVDEPATLLLEGTAGATERPAESCDATGRCTWNYAPTTTDGEGVFFASAVATDAFGKLAGPQSLGSFTVDLTAPQLVGTASFDVAPSADAPPVPVEVASSGATVTVRFELDDPTITAPVVTASFEGGTLDMVSVGAGTDLAYQLTIPAGAVSGQWGVTAVASDAAGNEAALDVITFEVDNIPPSPPGTTVSDAVVYHRAPWGADATSGQARFEVTVQPGRIEPGAWLLVYEDRRGDVIGAARADPAGVVAPGALVLEPPIDRPSVFVRTVDPAGNASAIVPVLDVLWTATMGAKQPGSGVENPHRFLERGVFRDVLRQTDDKESAGVAGLATTSSLGVVTSSSASWRRVEALPNGLPFAAEDVTAWYDSVRGLVYLSGLEETFFSRLETWTFNGDSFARVSQQSPDGFPELVDPSLVAFDEHRARAVLIGAGTDGVLTVHEHDGQRWRSVWSLDTWVPDVDETDPQAVPPHAFGVLAWDPSLGEVLFFVSGQGTWSWNGDKWSHRPEVDPEGDGSPTARNAPMMATDLAGGRVVLVGGQGVDGCMTTGVGPELCDDVWEWDGVSWRRLTTTGDAPPRAEGTLAFDSESQRLLLFGGSQDPAGECDNGGLNGHGYCTESEVWALDGTAWARVDAGGLRPRPRDFRAQLVSDRAGGGVLLFEGSGLEQPDAACEDGSIAYDSRCDQEDTWRFVGAAWQKVNVLESRSWLASPHDRVGHSVVPAGDAILLVGGATKDRPTDDPNYDAIAAPYCEDGVEPQCADEFEERCFLSELWELKRPGWQRLNAAEFPGRAFQGAAWDAARDRLVVFGGEVPADCLAGDVDAGPGLPPLAPWECPASAAGEIEGCVSNELWEWDGATWALGHDGSGDAPLPRSAPALTYDPVGERVLLFGGMSLAIAGTDGDCLDGTRADEDGYCAFDDLWAWKNTQWTRLNATDPEGDGDPAARGGASLAFDAARGVAVLFGGNTPSAACGDEATCQDTWEFDGTSWRLVEPTDPEGDRRPGPRSHATLVSDPAGGIVLVGGLDEDGTPITDVWRWDGSSWRREVAADPDGDGEPDRLLLPGAVMADGHFVSLGGDVDNASEAWEWQPSRGQRPAQLFEVSFGAAGTFGRAEVRAANLRWRAGASAGDAAGVDVLLWRAGRFERVGGNDVAADAPADIIVTLTSDDVQAALLAQRLTLAAVPSNQSATSPARVHTSYVELAMSYRYDEAQDAEPCGGVPAAGFCVADVAVYCEEGLLREVTCAASAGGAGRCEAGACVDQPDGAGCDGGRFRCEPGLLCIGAGAELGLCEAVSNQWTCNEAYYGSGDGCDCGCGVVDPDCANRAAQTCDFCDSAGSCNPLSGCPGSIQPYDNARCTVCGDGIVEGAEECDLVPADLSLCDDRCQWIVPASWTCIDDYFGTNDGCDCGCGALDPDCGDGGIGACQFCNDPGSCAEAELSELACGAIDPADIGQCSVWTCDPNFRGAGDGCDCGCGAPDPDCADLTPGACEFCNNPGTCDTVGDCTAIDAQLNTLCSTCGDSVVEGSEQCDPPDGATCDDACKPIDVVVTIPGWNCLPQYYGTNDGCDCGCGIVDPDCADSTPASCGYCDTCDALLETCIAALDPEDNSQCL